MDRYNKIPLEIVISKILEKCELLNYDFLGFDGEYKNINETYFTLKCNNDEHVWKTRYCKFIKCNSKCPKCSRRLKLSKEEVYTNIINICEKLNLTFLGFDGEYKNTNKSYFTLKCNKDDYTWKTTYNTITNKNFKQCPMCSKKPIISKLEFISKIEERYKNMNYIFLGFENYKKSESTLKIKCNNDDYTWITSYNSFIYQNHNCPKCSGNAKLKYNDFIDNINKRCDELNYTFVGFLDDFDKKLYIQSQKFKLKCNIDGYEWETTYKNFYVNKRKCSKCVNRYKKTLDEIINDINNICKLKKYIFHGFVGEYKNRTTKLILSCDNGHKWETTSYTNFISKDVCCPKCMRSRGEEQIEKILKENNTSYVTQKYFVKIKNNYLLISIYQN